MKFVKLIVALSLLAILGGCAHHTTAAHNGNMQKIYKCKTNPSAYTYSADDICVGLGWTKGTRGTVPVETIQEGIAAATLLSPDRKDYDIIIEQIYRSLKRFGQAGFYQVLPGRENSTAVWFHNYPKESHLKVSSFPAKNAFHDTFTIAY